MVRLKFVKRLGCYNEGDRMEFDAANAAQILADGYAVVDAADPVAEPAAGVDHAAEVTPPPAATSNDSDSEPVAQAKE